MIKRAIGKIENKQTLDNIQHDANDFHKSWFFEFAVAPAMKRIIENADVAIESMMPHDGASIYRASKAVEERKMAKLVLSMAQDAAVACEAQVEELTRAENG